MVRDLNFLLFPPPWNNKPTCIDVKANFIIGVSQSYTWLAAEYYCQQFSGGHLARVNDAIMNSWFVSNFPSISANRWIGYTRLFFNGTTTGWNVDEYYWIDGISSSYTNWASSEPSNVATENCVQFYTDGLWNDLGCNYQYNSVCRKSATFGSCSGSFVYQSSTGYCYMYVSTLMTWGAAQSNCESYSADLATVSSSTENTILQSYGSVLWIGFNSKYYTGTSSTHSDQFVWVDGSSITYTNWDSGEPNNYGAYSSVNEEFCTKINSTREWYGENCWLQYNFICEQPSLTLTSIPTPSPTYATYTCPSYSTSNSNNAIDIYETCCFSSCGITTLTINDCSCSGDTFIRLFDHMSTELVYNDDACGTNGLCSSMTYTTTSSSCTMMCLHEGCYST
eukprot:gene11207-15032_t